MENFNNDDNNSLNNLSSLNLMSDMFGDNFSYEMNESSFVFTLPYNDNFNIFDAVESLINDIQNNPSILNIGDNNNDEYVQFGIQFDIINPNGYEEEETNYFKTCSEINEKVSKSQKIKEGDSIMGEQCFICMDDYKVGEFKRVLPTCTHCFHKKCIDKWLKKKSSCPICRDELIK